MTFSINATGQFSAGSLSQANTQNTVRSVGEPITTTFGAGYQPVIVPSEKFLAKAESAGIPTTTINGVTFFQGVDTSLENFPVLVGEDSTQNKSKLLLYVLVGIGLYALTRGKRK